MPIEKNKSGFERHDSGRATDIDSKYILDFDSPGKHLNTPQTAEMSRVRPRRLAS
jgi:hypothetical protein